MGAAPTERRAVAATERPAADAVREALLEHPRFELGVPLGAGGMGAVVRAWDRLHGREVALKVGHPRGDADMARIAEEFGLLCTLAHPNVVRVLDLGRVGARWWLSSELVDGPRLDVWVERLVRDGLGAEAVGERLTALVGELLAALGWLSAQGLVHGDLKPANILVSDDTPVLIDFGLAGSGEVVLGGTRSYLAPELSRAHGRPTSASDLFALGRTLERLLERSGVSAPRLFGLAQQLTADEPAARPSVEEALQALGRELRPVRGASRDAWVGAVERAMERLVDGDLRLDLPSAFSRPMLTALAARLMSAGRTAWLCPDGEGLEPLGRMALALGQALTVPTARADDQREVLDGFADAMVGALRRSGERLTLLVADPARLGAGRFVLSRLLEAGALERLVLAGRGAEVGLERGVERSFGPPLVVAAVEASGRRFGAEWQGLSADARRLALAFSELGGALHLDEARAAEPGLEVKRALAELFEAGLVLRAPGGRTALDPELREALPALVEVTDSRRRERLAVVSRWVEEKVELHEAMLAAGASHAEALGEASGVALYEAAAERAERAFAWERAAQHHLGAARLGASPDTVFFHASEALRALRAAGPSPLTNEALTLLERAAEGDEVRELKAGLERARVLAARGDNGAAIAAASKVVLHAAGAGAPDSLRFEAHLVRGTAAAQTEDKQLAEADLGQAALIAEALGDLHALGRTANNLGLLAFHRGDLVAAAKAWERAADAKRRTGDKRGERIGLQNRGLAMRELGRLADASALASRAKGLADEIGDRVGQATAALLMGQLAIDSRRLAEARGALAKFAEVAWKPAMVELDGELVTARLLVAEGQTGRALAMVRGVMERALAAKNEPVLAESWALSVVLSGEPERAPELLHAALVRAEAAPGGLSALLLIASGIVRAHEGDWGGAKRLLAKVVAMGPLPPGAWLASGAAVATAQMVAPELVLGLEVPEGEAMKDDARGVEPMRMEHPLTRPEALWVEVAQVFGRGGRSPALLGDWAVVMREATGASRCEIVFADGAEVDDGTAPRFVSVGKRVMASRKTFVASDEGLVKAFSAPLGEEGREPVGALVLSFEPGVVLAEPGLGELGALLGALIERAVVRAKVEALEQEVGRLSGELAQRAERHEAELTALRDQLEQSQSAMMLRFDYGQIVHRSARMRRVLETLDKVTDRDLPVLVLGESGVGKELLARALHFNGPRKNKRFIAENCGAIPKDLFESHFFGHVRGAFTGATGARQGLFEAADGGTIFLDEVGELPLDMQVKLLRVLQEKKVRPVGSTREVPVEFRLVAATNRDLAQMVAEGRFREDLYYRVAVVKVEVPPLRDRRDDILPIAQHLLEVHGSRLGRTPRLTPEAANKLVGHDWPGNVRELENEIMRAVALCEGPEIKPRHLSPNLGGGSQPRRAAAGTADEQTLAAVVKRMPLEPLDALFGRVEKAAIERALEEHGGQKAATARALGLSRPGLDAKLQRHGIDVGVAKGSKAKG